MQPNNMIAMKFKDNAKIAFAKVLSDLIQSDGIVNQGEIECLHHIFMTTGIDNSHLKRSSMMTLSHAVSVLQHCGPMEKAAIRQAIRQLSIADGDIDPNESVLITALTLAIDITLPEAKGLHAELVSIPDLSFDIRNTVVYVESSYHKTINAAIRKDYEAICLLLEKHGKQLFYLPTVMSELRRKKKTFLQTLTYLEPLLTDSQLHLIEHDMKHFNCSMLSQEIFLNYLNSRGFKLNSPAFLFKIDNQKASFYQDFLVLSIDRYPLETLNQFYKLNDSLLQLPEGEHIADELAYNGLHKIIIDTILKYHSYNGLSRLLVSEDGRLYLIDRNRTEVKMQTIARALYILYLRHEEGIALTALGDHREELLEIYAMISNYNNTEKLRQTVDNLVDFVGSTINPLLSRIKRAFTSLLGEQAKDYLIEGRVRDKKRINLPRNMVTDELR